MNHDDERTTSVRMAWGAGWATTMTMASISMQHSHGLAGAKEATTACGLT